MATVGGFCRMSQLLVEFGADVNSKNKEGQTPLHGAVGQGWDHVVDFLSSLEVERETENEEDRQKQKEEEDATNRARKTSSGSGQSNNSMEDPTLQKNKEKVRLLDLDAQDENGRTPLHYASQHLFSSSMFQKLLELGADPSIHDNANEFPLPPKERLHQHLFSSLPLIVILILLFFVYFQNSTTSEESTQLLTDSEL
eukprot:TRINITY_DN4699_c0_g1_i1.p1 TRINITY_DN4699_c0_g1~~TRINITY_DN4699_c0_g1_i1.p1  ORF type:complete len:205 (+),score=62.96 TRINITY_DN4699_c0_g1_i1:24-617(+)